MKSHYSLFKPVRSPYWYLQWIDLDGRKKQKSTRCKDKSEAIRVLSDLKNFVKEKQKPVLFSRFAEQFIAANVGTLSKGTLRIYSYAFTNFIRLVGDISMNRIGPREWDTYRSGRLKEIKPVTVSIDLRTLRAALSTAVRWKLIETNPFKGQPTCKIPETDAPFITSEQLKTIQLAIRNADVRDIAAIAFNTGMRQGEIVSLKWMGVDLVSGVIFVRNDANFKTKTGKQRAIPMNGEVSTILARRKASRTAGSDSVFPGITNDFVSKQFKKGARSVLGINTSVHFHSLRHSFCSNLVQAGASIRVVQSLAGHASIGTTEKYLYSVTQDARNAVELL